MAAPCVAQRGRASSVPESTLRPGHAVTEAKAARKGSDTHAVLLCRLACRRFAPMPAYLKVEALAAWASRWAIMLAVVS